MWRQAVNAVWIGRLHYALLAAAYELTQTVAEIRDCSPTYWRDTLAKIGFA